MATFTINPPNSALVNAKGLITPEWYRFLANLQRILGDDIIASIQGAPLLTYSISEILQNERVLTGGDDVSVTIGSNLATLGLTETGVVPGIYGNSSYVAAFDVDENGRLTGATNVAISPVGIGAAEAATTLTAGAGLTGGGDLSASRTFDVGAGAGITVNANDVAIDTGYINSGSYTPTITILGNVAATTAHRCYWQRIGSIVSVSGALEVDPTASGAYCDVTLSLPIASAIAAIDDAWGVVTANTPPGTTGACIGHVASDTVQLSYFATGTANGYIFFEFKYQILP